MFVARRRRALGSGFAYPPGFSFRSTVTPPDLDTLDTLRLSLAGVSDPVLALLVGAAAVVLEDPTLAAIGVLAQRGELPLVLATAGAFAGVLAADVLVFAAGRFVGRHSLETGFVARLLGERIEQARHWITRHGVAATLLSRFLPGTRTATHAAAGALGMPWRTYLPAATVAALLWVPAVVAVAWVLGPVVVRFFESAGAHPLLALPVGILTLIVAPQIVARLFRLPRILRRIRWLRQPRLPLRPAEHPAAPLDTIAGGDAIR